MDFRQQRPSSGVRRNRPDLWWVLCLIVGSVVLAVFLVQCAKNQSVGRLGEAMAPPTIEGAAYVGMETCLLCHEDQAKKMEGISLTIGAKTSTKGKIFGSVNPIQISEALVKAGFEIDRKIITLKDDPIKEIGKYVANIKLHREVEVEIEFEIVTE